MASPTAKPRPYASPVRSGVWYVDVVAMVVLLLITLWVLFG
jgi:hypothetical protein